MINNVKDIKGISIISLLITIVVLLILTGITIGTTTGEKGTIEQANLAKENVRANNVEEEKELWLIKKEMGSTEKALSDILQELEEKELLTSDEVTEILNNEKNEIKIGNKTISFLTKKEIIKIEPSNIEDWEYIVDTATNTATLTCYKGKDTTVIIPNYIDGVPVKKITGLESENPYGAIWSSTICEDDLQKTITKVIITRGIEEIDDYTFVGSEALINVSISNTVKSIGAQAFFYCENLLSIKIPESVTYLGEWMFWECPKLKSAYILGDLKVIGNGAFFGCGSLEELHIAGTVETIGDSAFAGCRKLKSVNIEKGVTAIQDKAFYHCDGLATINLPSTVTLIGTNVFEYCDGLITINIDKAENSITGSPWGATNATINWNG